MLANVNTLSVGNGAVAVAAVVASASKLSVVAVTTSLSVVVSAGQQLPQTRSKKLAMDAAAAASCA